MDTMLTAASPQDEQNGIGRREELGRLLRAEIGEGEARLTQIDAEAQTLRRVVEQAYVMLRALGLEPEPVPAPLPAVSSGSPNGTRLKPTVRTEFVAGNKGDKTPPRRPEYATVSLPNAARRLLASGQTLRLDDLAHAIYDIRDTTQLQAAKSSLRSTMGTGVTRGIFERVSDGAFRAAPQGMEGMST